MNAERESRSKVVPATCLLVGGGLLLTLAWVSAGAAQVQTNRSATDARAHLAAARRALQNSDVQKARTELELALKLDPALEEAHVALGTLELQQGNDASAIEQFRRALELNAKSFPAHYNLALAYLRQHKQTEGRQELERAVTLDPRNADANYNFGLVLLEEGRPEEAISRLRVAQAGSPARPDVAFNLVRAQLAANHPDEAEREAEAGSKTFARDANWFAAVGRIFFENGRPREAAEYLAPALHLRPDSEEIKHQLAAARLQLQDPAGALAVLQSGDHGAQDAEHHYLLASAYLLMHRLPEAETESRQAMALDPREPRYLLLAARVLQRRNEQAAALELLEQAIRLEPAGSDPYYSKGVSYYFLRRYADARQSLAQALQLSPHSAQALFLYAATLVNEGKNAEAEDYLHRAIALEPANARFQYHLGGVLLRDNRPIEAQKAFEKSIELKPDYGPPHYQLGKLLARSGSPDVTERAVGELETAVRDQPDLAEAYYQLSRLYARLGQNDKSRQALEVFNHFKGQEKEAEELVNDVEQELRGE
jgi:tetratricopeptide (TPR) repeat protein